MTSYCALYVRSSLYTILTLYGTYIVHQLIYPMYGVLSLISLEIPIHISISEPCKLIGNGLEYRVF